MNKSDNDDGISQHMFASLIIKTIVPLMIKIMNFPHLWLLIWRICFCPEDQKDHHDGKNINKPKKELMAERQNICEKI